MKAAVLTEVKKPLAIREVPDPVAVPGHAVVALKASALNHRDLWTQIGLYPNIKVPIILGSDGAGVVESVGSLADKPWVGRDVIVNPRSTGALIRGPRREFPHPRPARRRHLRRPPGDTRLQPGPAPDASVWAQAAALPLAG